jgi:DNA adenine methylase
MAMKTKSALSYFGSDSEVAKPIAAMLDHCKHVTIPFCGGMSILPHLKARAIIANDFHNQVINFYRFASGRFGEVAQRELIEKCQSTLSHPEEINLAKMYCDSEMLRDSLNQAWAFWVLCWVGRKGKGGTKNQGGMPSVRRTADGGTNATRIKAAADDLEEWKKQFQRCEWESVCFRELLPKVADKPLCGVYCDPPWVGPGSGYLHSFTEQDHRDLASLLRRFEHTTVVVRYGDHPLIRELYADPYWTIIESESRDQCNKWKGEIWITNKSEAS